MKRVASFIAAVMFFLVLLVSALGAAPAQPQSAADIMRKVAAKQDEARDMRSSFIYQQDIRMRFHKFNGKTAREEERIYTVTPTANSFGKTLMSFKGRYEKDGKLIAYDKPGHTYKDMDIDGELIDDLTDSLVNEKHSRDGFSPDLFPLTSAAQLHYDFTLHGREQYRSREVYRLSFKPRKEHNEEWEDGLWAGELLVDASEFQPVLINTQMAKSIPLMVRTLLGTNLKGLGFKLEYDKVAEGVWFPVRYGGEFELKAVFFYKRRISVGMHSSEFRRTEVSARVEYQPPEVTAQPPDE